MSESSCYDVVIIGAGIAGTSVASELVPAARVALVESESQPGYHSTGRSAAMYLCHYGNDIIRKITAASRPFLDQPPDGFTATPLLTPRGALKLALPGEVEALRQEVSMSAVTALITPAEALELVPALDQAKLGAAAYEAGAMDLDVHALHAGYLHWFQRHGGDLLCSAPVHALQRGGGEWRIHTRDRTLTGKVLVNAAGGWADQVAQLAQAHTLDLVPMRRTVAVIPAPAGHDISSWPLTFDRSETFYFKPDAGRLLVSPADETPVVACDIQPDELDVAIGIDRFETATTITVDRVDRSWAGLRTFAPDRSPVVGWDPEVEGLFWAVAYGGYGIQMSAALKTFAAALIREQGNDDQCAATGISEAELSPARFAV